MAKHKGRRRRKNSRHDDESEDENHTGNDRGHDPNGTENGKTERHKSHHNNKKNSDLSFAERRELQRKAAADRRRQKMKCYLCGQTGHVRRECPGIADDGRGESKYTKSNGDAGAVHLKHKGRPSAKNNHHKRNTTTETKTPDLPSGFERRGGSCGSNEEASVCENNHDGEGDESNRSPPFWYYDAGFDESEDVLEYLRFGRHGHSGTKSNNPHNHTQVSRKDAIEEYDDSMRYVCETTNFGGCIVRAYLPPPDETEAIATTCEPWTPTKSFPFSWFRERPSLIKFVLGYRCGENNYDESHGEEAFIERLVETAEKHEGVIVGFFADLNYTSLSKEDSPAFQSPSSLEDSGLRSSQMQRLRNTLVAASRIGCPVQVRIAPGYKACQHSATPASITGEGLVTTATDAYSLAIRDLGTILLERPSWKVHLSRWNGKAEHLVALSGAFSSSNSSSQTGETNRQLQTLCFGFDGRVGFSKAVHLHESAFEVRPDQIVLETGGPGTLPPVVAKHCGRNAFCHSGHLPFVAEELARHLARNPRNTLGDSDQLKGESLTEEITAETVARWASTTTKALYGMP